MRQNDYYPSVVGFRPNPVTDPIVQVRPQISLKFNIELLVDIINSDEKINQIVILVEENSDTPVRVKYINYSQKVLTIEPEVDLNPGSAYQLTILNSIQSVEGRQATANRSFVFSVSATEIDQIDLISPANYTSSSSIPAFTWNAVAPPTGSGFLQYRVELDDTIAFKSVNSVGWSTITTSTSAIPGVSLTPSNHYFWRVRGEFITPVSSSVGMWSDPYVWYYGTFLQPSPSTRQTYPEAVPFNLSDSSGLENGLSNQLNAPPMSFNFYSSIDPSTVTSTSVYMTKEAVDGWPSSTKYPVNIGTTVNGSNLTVTMTDGMAPNSRYTLYITTDVADTAGNHLQKTIIRYFTSRYTPLYMGANVLRANFGTHLINVPEDLLNMHIYRVSLDVNRHWILYYNPLIGGPTEDQVRGMVFLLSYAMERWVEHESAARVLTMRYYELLDSVDSSKRLGDYQESHGYNILEDIRNQIKEQKKLAIQWVSEFSRHRARPRSVRPSERCPIWFKNTDYAWQNFRRDSI